MSLLFLLGTVLYGENTLIVPSSFQAKFRQTVTDVHKKVTTHEGGVLYSTPNRFKWSYIKPVKKDVCTDGKELLVVDYDLEQVSAYTILQGLNLSEILKNAKPHRKSVYNAVYKGKTYTIQVDNSKRLSRVAYFDDLDNAVLIIFDTIKYADKPIEDTLMQCKYPSSFDLIEG
jgi:outer membrane lipoprotein carrier protein